MRVLFVSKPVVAPFHDGAKCLVRDVASGLRRVTPVILSTPGAAPLASAAGGFVERAAIYSDAGSYAPAFLQNARAAAWLLLRSQADVWHFVFAPNARTSQVGRWLSRRKRRPVVQTIASCPRSFASVHELLFGELVVAQSAWTEAQVRTACVNAGVAAPQMVVIPPPVPEVIARAPSVTQAARAALGIPEGAPLFVYPGDLEVSSGAEVTAQIAERIRARLPTAVVVFAYRQKTPAAEPIALELRTRLAGHDVRFAASLPDVLSLIASATAVLFPVDDLYGKVDFPIVLLESMVLGVPVVALAEGPLAELDGAELLASRDVDAWISALERFALDEEHRRRRIEHQRGGVVQRCRASAVAHAYEELYLELVARERQRGVAQNDALSEVVAAR